MTPCTEDYRHQCEVRALIRWRLEYGREWAQEWLTAVEKRRGKAAADRLRADVAQQWGLGNRGTRGEWKTTASN